MLNYFRQLAAYNQWANTRLYKACMQLSESEYHQSRKAFFDSIHGTLNHLLLVDRLWLGRVVDIDSGITQLDTILYAELNALWLARQQEDGRILELIDSFTDGALKESIHYKTTEGEDRVLVLHQIFEHLFNHQTHHRGQVHNMLSQAGVEPPVLDLLYFYNQK